MEGAASRHPLQIALDYLPSRPITFLTTKMAAIAVRITPATVYMSVRSKVIAGRVPVAKAGAAATETAVRTPAAAAIRFFILFPFGHYRQRGRQEVDRHNSHIVNGDEREGKRPLAKKQPRTKHTGHDTGDSESKRNLVNGHVNSHISTFGKEPSTDSRNEAKRCDIEHQRVKIIHLIRRSTGDLQRLERNRTIHTYRCTSVNICTRNNYSIRTDSMKTISSEIN